MGDTQNNQESGYWGWLSAAATKAQELAETAKKVAQEQAIILAKQAEELREKYDLEVATSMFTGGAAPPKYVNPVEIKLTKADLNQLDMIYITENLLAMAFPREREEIAKGKGRVTSEEGPSDGNDINVVAAYLKKKHAGKFMIWNISEESYDYTKFQDQVLEYRFPGHPAPPLGLLFKICTSIESWLDADESNIAIVHCLTGKGRTATLIACALTWLGEFDSPMQALQYVAQRRGTAVDYLTIPSQRRYIQYFSNLLDGVKPSSEPLLLRRIIVNSIPGFGFLNAEDLSTQGCCPYIQLFKNGKLIASAAAVNEKSEEGGASTMKLRWVLQSEGSATFKIDCVVQGDVLLRCRHASVMGTRISMFRAAFHTGYISGNVLRLTRAQLDGTSSDTRYAEDFFVDLIFAPVDQNILNETTTNKELLDAAAHDKYELGLHKDAKFWESVTARKNKGKKRKSRKFTADQADPFSIFDDGKLSGDDQDEIDFKITKINNANQVPVNNNDELIKQLAQLEGDGGDFTEEVASPTANASNNKGNELTSPSGSTAGEIQSLEDLEKELGLSDLQLFSSTEKPKAVSVTATPNDNEPRSNMKDDEDNLDELERYLQSLSTQN